MPKTKQDTPVTNDTPRKRAAVTTKRRRSPTQRTQLVHRLWLAAEAQVRQIESRLTLDTTEPAECERDARTMAVLVKTLRDLNALDAARDRRASKREGNTAAAATPEVNYDDPRQIDEFRRELARRIEAIKSGRAADAAVESR
jgi:hypothetical protein